MPYKDKEKHKEYHKKYREENKEKKNQYMKNYYEENKQFKLEYQNEYRLGHKEQIKDYFKTDQGKKSMRIGAWKHFGLVCDNIDKLYEHYLNTNECDNCGIELIEGYASNRKCMDHNHNTGEFRNILCHKCNTMRRFYEPD